MKSKKIGFFKRVKDAVFNFDEYKTFAQEKFSTCIKFLLKFVLFFSIAIALIILIKAADTVSIIASFIENECPEFGFEDNVLVVQGENKEFDVGTKEKRFGIVVNSEKENLSDVPKANDYEYAIVFLKDKIAINNEELTDKTFSYNYLNQMYDLKLINKEKVKTILLSQGMLNTFLVGFGFTIILAFIIYSIDLMLEILFLSLLGFLMAQILGIKLKYRSIFSICVYSLILSNILLIVYSIFNIIIGFNIVYFGIAYKAIAYVYLVTALLIIRGDLIKQNIGVTKIEEEPKKELEKQQEEQQEEKPEKNKENKEKKEKKKKEKNENVNAPEGT